MLTRPASSFSSSFGSGSGLRVAAFVSLLSLLTLLLAGSASAAAIYSYTGNPFSRFQDTEAIPGAYTTSNSVQGSFTVASELPANLNGVVVTPDVLGFSFTDGRQTFTDSTPLALEVIQVSTDAQGAIVAWQILLKTATSGPRNEIRTVHFGSETRDRGEQFLTVGVADSGTSLLAPGSWSVVPEPSTALLLGLGLAMASARRSRAA